MLRRETVFPKSGPDSRIDEREPGGCAGGGGRERRTESGRARDCKKNERESHEEGKRERVMKREREREREEDDEGGGKEKGVGEGIEEKGTESRVNDLRISLPASIANI